MRIATPTAALLAVAALIFFAMFDPFRREIGGLTVASSASTIEIVMSHPRLTGSRKDGAYVVNAVKAIQDVAHRRPSAEGDRRRRRNGRRQPHAR